MKKRAGKAATEAVINIVTSARNLGISGNKLSKEGGFDRSTLRRWTSGECEPTLSNFMALQSAFLRLIEISKS